MLMKASAWVVVGEMKGSVFNIQALVKSSLIYFNFSGANKNQLIIQHPAD